jgi:hypothetical protein
VGASPDKTILRQPGGRWSVMGFLMTLSSFSDDDRERMESLCKSWTIE